MDEKLFDALTRTLAAPRGRRVAIKAGAAALFAAGAVTDTAAAAKCRAAGSICRKHGDCCDNICGERDSLGRRRCACPPGTHDLNGVCRPSCFVAGTRVAMADGTNTPIEQIAFGDLVLGQDGAVNRVIGVERPLLTGRKLYALNGGEPFVTAEHPFLTAAGWKSIDPAATADENPSLPVGRLTTGDTLIELADVLVPASVGGLLDRLDIRTRFLPLREITAQTADPATTVYNLLLDGSHTYFANELLVHNKQ